MSIIFLFLPQKCLSWCHLKTIYTLATRRSSFPWVHTLFQINEDLLLSFLKLFVMHHGHNYQSFLRASPISCSRLQANLWMNYFLRVSLLPAAIVNSYAAASIERWETQERSCIWITHVILKMTSTYDQVVKMSLNDSSTSPMMSFHQVLSMNLSIFNIHCFEGAILADRSCTTCGIVSLNLSKSRFFCRLLCAMIYCSYGFTRSHFVDVSFHITQWVKWLFHLTGYLKQNMVIHCYQYCITKQDLK